LPNGLSSKAEAINDQNQIVGLAMTSNNELHAVLWTKAGIHDLNQLIPPNSGWVLNEAFDINNSGQITGNGVINGENHAFLLTPQ